ncbi:hypothetical protein SteCoe_16525 [Stentor coeruleus]|uniref:Uncharacterized protein n=1 Tax=Stentor coeruleus TaxID=5963 RepID=A0A1R2C0Z7_9CILI|nr:hypothetical protein SteCoe_16525 [Stentor coeruleus]
MSTRSGLLKDTLFSGLPKLVNTRDANDDFTAASSLRSHVNDELPNLSDSRNKSMSRRSVYTFKNHGNHIIRYQKTHKKNLSSTTNNTELIEKLEKLEKIEKIEEENVNSILDDSFIQKQQTKNDELLQENKILKNKCEELESQVQKLQKENSNLLKHKDELEALKDEKAKIAKALTLKRSMKAPKIDVKLIELFAKDTSKEYISERELEELELLLTEEKKKSEQFSELFTQEHKKNIILHEQVKVLNGVIDLFKVYENRSDSSESILKLLKEKNDEYYSQLVKYSDQVYEKTLENRQLIYQNSALAKDLQKSNEKMKELPELRSHITTLLQHIRKLRQEITEAAHYHLSRMAGNHDKNEEHEEFISKITTIADQAKEDLVSILKTNLGKMMSSNSLEVSSLG